MAFGVGGKFDAKARSRKGRGGMDDEGAVLSESGFTGLAGFAGFRFRSPVSRFSPQSERLRGFVRIRIYGISGIFRISLLSSSLFATTANPAKANMDERLQIKDEPEES